MGTYVFRAAAATMTGRDMSRTRDLCQVLSHCDVADTVRQCPEFPFPRSFSRMGDMYVEAPNGATSTKYLLKDVLHAPSMSATLISLGRLDDAGLHISISNGTCQIRHGPRGALIATIPKIDGLYRVTHGYGEQALSASTPQISLFELHKRLGHTSYTYLKRMLKDGALAGVNVDPSQMDETECEACLKAEAVRAPIASVRKTPIASHFGDIVHLDLWVRLPSRARSTREFSSRFLCSCSSVSRFTSSSPRLRPSSPRPTSKRARFPLRKMIGGSRT